MLGPKRDITGRGLPVPRSVTLRFCACEVRARAATTARDKATPVQEFSRRCHTEFMISGGRSRRLDGGLKPPIASHRLDDEVGELRRAGFASDVAGQLVAGAIDIFQRVPALERGIVLAQMA